MNWLAHLLLSPSDIHARVGNLAADIVRATEWLDAPPDAQRGLRLHATIDAFTDAHPIVRKSIQRLRPAGRLRPVVIDIAYDHVLAKTWDECMPEPLDAFVEGFFEEAFEVLPQYPQRVQHFLRSIYETRRLTGYVKLAGIEDAMLRLDERLSERVRSRECTHEYFGDVANQVDSLQEDFFVFFPELVEVVDRATDMDGVLPWRPRRQPVS